MAELISELSTRLGRRENVIIIGAQAPVSLEQIQGWTFVRVHCDGPDSTWGPLEQARQRVEHLLGRDADASPTSLDELVQLRQRLLDGDTPERSASMVLVEALNRLSRAASGRAALVLDAVDAADEATIEALDELLRDPRLEVCVILTLRVRPTGAIAQVIEQLEAIWGESALLDLTFPTDQPALFAWGQLERDHLLVARACAAVGDVFEVTHVARLLDRNESEVLHILQHIADAGAPIIDRGEGRLSFAPRSLKFLRRGILPSLARHWSERLVRIVLERGGDDGAKSQDLRDALYDMTAQDRADGSETQEAPEIAAYADVFEIERPHRVRAADQAAKHAEAAGLDHIEERPRSVLGGGEPSSPEVPVSNRGDHARAAQYLQGAGRVEEAVGHLIAAARQVASRRDAPRALLLTRRALELVKSLPSTEPARALHARVLAEIGRIQWRGAAVGTPFSLGEALQTVEQALEVLEDDSAPVLRAELFALVAGICYDLGDDDSLERASSALTRAARLLAQAGAPVDAARLLNDQAAVLVRFGDPVQAVFLLEQSRQVFESMRERDATDEVAARELAETHHLLARIPMHAQIREGAEARALGVGLEHAARAARLYQEIQDSRALARVWETMGRIELSLGRLDAAEEHLGRALFIQRKLGDVTGLARTAAGLSELLLARDEHAAALSLLAESSALNARKGSPRGIVFNLRAFDELAQAIAMLPEERIEELEPGLIELDTFLQRATEDLGIVPISMPRP